MQILEDLDPYNIFLGYRRHHMKHHIGIMQGRLTEPKGRGIQFFPFENWEKEFYDAKEIGLDEIEFIFDYPNYEKNPLWQKAGLTKIQKIINETGVCVRSICFDYFIRRPFYKKEGHDLELLKKENTHIIKQVISAMDLLGISLIEIPLVDNSSLKNDYEKLHFKNWLNEIVLSSPKNINFSLETDLPPEKFLAYIQDIGLENVGANYDSGNSSGIGYDLYQEVTTLGSYIFNIHIKDRVYRGGTVKLGNGSADFDRLFRGLKEINYKNSFILQAARGTDGNEKNNIVSQMLFTNHYIKKYDL